MSAAAAAFYASFRDVPAGAWRWPNFAPAEIASKGDGSLKVVPAALDALERARALAGRPLAILSAYRDPLHNARVGGAPLSRHKAGDAFDIALAGADQEALAAALKGAGFTGFGLGYRTFVHADLGPHRSW